MTRQQHPTSPFAHSKLEPLLRPVHAFFSTESAGGVVLIVAAVAALVWANSPWAHSYREFWHTSITVGAGSRSLAMSLDHWVNDGLMVLFFLLVGLEIKRELLFGELRSARRAILPMMAAAGGMVVPTLIYAAMNARSPGAAGWGIPMATDIAFAVGVLAIVGRSVPTSIKVFLLAIAIVDDLGAVLVIALFYTSGISLIALGVAAAFLVGLVTLNILRVHRPMPYLLLGFGLWAATLLSGIHATIAGVLLAFAIPATRQIKEQPYVDYMREKLGDFERDTTAAPDRITENQSHALHEMEEASEAVQTPLVRIEHLLLRPVAFIIVPLFALANAGVNVRSAGGLQLGSSTMWGVLLGLLVGKPVGVLLASWLTVKSGAGALPEGGTWRQLVSVAFLCGIGFTMSLFIGNLAFEARDDQLAATKVGILLASLLSGIAGAVSLASIRRST